MRRYTEQKLNETASAWPGKVFMVPSNVVVGFGSTVNCGRIKSHSNGECKPEIRGSQESAHVSELRIIPSSLEGRPDDRNLHHGLPQTE